MRVISGLVQRNTGAMRLDGRSIGGLPAHRIVEQGIAHVPKNRRLFPRLTVEDNLRIGALCRGPTDSAPNSWIACTNCSRD